MTELSIRPVDADQLGAVRELFGSSRQTRHCSCMAFCSTPGQFALGWYGGGNQRRFDALTRAEAQPMGLIALDDDVPVGWCACGPQGRYRPSHHAAGSSSATTWLIACLYVRPDHGGGVVVPLLRQAVALARTSGAGSVEAWPVATGTRSPGEIHTGREGVFARLGFRTVAQLSRTRVLMRLELNRPPGAISIG